MKQGISVSSILFVLLSCMISCKKEVHDCGKVAEIDSCLLEPYIFSPLTQVFGDGYSSTYSYNPLNVNQVAFTFQDTLGNERLGVFDFSSHSVIWSIQAAHEYVDWGNNGKILFWKNVGGIIGIINADGSAESVINTQGFAYNPKWSYSGNKMVYSKIIGGQHYQIIADANGNALDTLRLYSSNYSLAANDEVLLYNSYIGANVGFRTLNLQTGAKDSLFVADSTIAGLAEGLIWDLDGSRFYWHYNGALYEGNMATKNYRSISEVGCAGFNISSMAKHPSMYLFTVKKRYERYHGPDSLFITLLDYVYNPTTNTYSYFKIPIE